MNKRILASLICLLLPVSAESTVLFSDRFETTANWDGRTDAVSSINSESGGSWQTVWCATQSDESHAEISDAYGYSGKGLRFTLSANGCGAPGVAQESCLFSNMSSVSESTLYWGFRFKYTGDWGTSDSNKTLKMSRIYMGGTSIIPGIIGASQTVSVFPFDGGAYLSTGYNISDTNWHTYIFQFTAGTLNDGIIRLWVDGSLEYENTTVNYAASTISYEHFPMLQGNLSGGYNGTGLYTYWDDYIWATTKEEVDAFLGIMLTPPSITGIPIIQGVTIR